MTVISHFYNEEYLLPYWLLHHKQLFDHGILINYSSTDNSVDIIKALCPTWEIRDSRNQEFSAGEVDKEVMDIENTVPGFKLVLNTTEFLVPGPDFHTLKFTDRAGCYEIPRATIVDEDPIKRLSKSKPLVLQKHWGFIGNNNINGGSRFIHNHDNGRYTLGRHQTTHRVDQVLSQSVIYWYGFAPFTTEFINRKLQIKHRIPDSEKAANLGFQHLWTAEQLEQKRVDLLQKCEDLSKRYNCYGSI